MRSARALAILLALPGVALFIPGFAFAYTSPGHATGYVNDFAGVLSAPEKAALEQELTAFDASTTNQIAVVTVTDLGGDYIEHYAEELFKEWGIGTSQHDNGVLLLLAVTDRQLRIEVGYGLEGALPDSVAQRIINTDMVPHLKAGDYDGAVAAGVSDIEQATEGEYQGGGTAGLSPDTVNSIIVFGITALLWLAAILGRSKSVWAGGVVGGIAGASIASVLGIWIVGGIATTAGLIVLGVLFDMLVSGAYARSKALGVRAPWWIGGGHGGGGFGGFGGGSSGGGGASGSW